jgi:hypothetical protein
MSTIKTNAIQTTAGKPILNSTGSIIQVVHSRDDSTYGTTSTSYQQITGLTPSITPSSTSNNILINLQIKFYHDPSSGIHFSIRRNGTSLINADTMSLYHAITTNPDYRIVSASIDILDSPASTSSVAYTLFYRSDTGAQVYVNRPANTTFSSRSGVFGSTSFTLKEVVA